MLRKFYIKKLGGAFVIVVLLCVGTNYYAEWSNERFTLELGEPPPVPVASEPAVETSNDEVLPLEQATPLEQPELVNENADTDAVVFDPEPVKISVSTDADAPVEETELSELITELDMMSLLSEFELPEEVALLLDEEADTEDFEEAETYFVEEYGQSPEVEVIVDRLQQMSDGQVEIDPLTGLFEAWIQLLPEEDQMTHRQLTNVITQLHQARTFGGNSPVRIEVRVRAPETVRRFR